MVLQNEEAANYIHPRKGSEGNTHQEMRNQLFQI